MNIDTIKNKMNALQSIGQKKEKIDYEKYLWKPKAEGKYQIRIVPSEQDKDNPFKEVFVHYGFAKYPIYALTNWDEKDPIVEFAKQLRTASDSESWKLAKKLDPKMRVFAPVIVRGEEERGVRLWEFGKEIYMQLLGIAEDEDYGDYTDLSEGRDFTIDVVTGDIGGRQGLKSSIRIKPKQTPLSGDKKQIEGWLINQPDILNIQLGNKKDFDSLKKILQDFLVPEGEDEEENTVENETIEHQSKVAPTTDKAPYTLEISKPKKKSKTDKFDDLFEEDKTDEDDLPF